MKTISALIIAAAMSGTFTAAAEAQSATHHPPRAHHRRITLGDFSAMAQTPALVRTGQNCGINGCAWMTPPKR